MSRKTGSVTDHIQNSDLIVQLIGIKFQFGEVFLWTIGEFQPFFFFHDP